MGSLWGSPSLALLLASAALSGSATAEVIDQVVSLVGPMAILDSEVRSLSEKLKASPGLARMMGLSPQSSRQDVLAHLEEEKIIQITLQELDLQVSDAEVDGQINKIAEQNRITREQLQQGLQREGIPFPEYRDNIRSQLQRRNVFDRELRRGGGPSEAELRGYWEQNRPQEYRLGFIALADTPPNRKTVSSLVKNSRTGEEFLKSGARSGAASLGWISSDSLQPEVQKALAARQGTGGVGPVRIENKVQGYFIFEVRRAPDEAFAKMREELSRKLGQEDFDRRLKLWIAAKRKSLPVKGLAR